MLRILCVVLTFAALSAGPCAVHAAVFDAFLEIDGIRGETEDRMMLKEFSLTIPSASGTPGLLPWNLKVAVSDDVAKALAAISGDDVARRIALSLMPTHGQTSDDVIVDGRIITAENFDSVGVVVYGFAAMTVEHKERQATGGFLTTASGGWGLHGTPGFSGAPSIYDAFADYGALRGSDGSLQLTLVPEPAKAWLWLAAIGLLLLHRVLRSARRARADAMRVPEGL